MAKLSSMECGGHAAAFSYRLLDLQSGGKAAALRRFLVVFSLVAAFLAGCRVETSSEPLDQEILEWRVKRVKNLRGDDGWLTVVGLHWLKEGENTVGSAKSNNVVLPEGKAPELLGSIFLENGKLRLQARPESGVASIPLATDAEGDPTIVAHGPLRFHVIKRGERFAVRVKDRESQARAEFRGLEYYPIDAKWRVEARFEPYQPPRKIPIANIIGTTEEMTSPGALVFEVDGTTYRIDPVVEKGESELFIIVGDKTSGRETYGGGRYLYAAMPGADRKVIVDFNKAYNPPCVFTDFATCPLPPSQNKLPIAVTAGEKVYKH